MDATSFDVMRTLRLREALAFDGDFTAVGDLDDVPITPGCCGSPLIFVVTARQGQMSPPG